MKKNIHTYIYYVSKVQQFEKKVRGRGGRTPKRKKKEEKKKAGDKCRSMNKICKIR